MCPVYWDSFNSFAAQDNRMSQRATKLCLLAEILQIDSPAFCNGTKKKKLGLVSTFLSDTPVVFKRY